jgi:5-dehydro-2-deoxygluconokinase
VKDRVFELLATGRIGVDLYPPEIGLPLSKVESFEKFLGGSPTNVAVAASCFGHSSAVITRVGDDGFGEYVRGALHDFGVVDRYVALIPFSERHSCFPRSTLPTTSPSSFYKEPKADPVFQDALRTRPVENW